MAVGAGGFYFLYSALPRLGADRVGLFAGLVPFGAMGSAADRVGLFAGLVPFGAMGSAILLGAGTIRPADIAGAIMVAAGGAAGANAARAHTRDPRAQERETSTAAAPQLSRTRTGAPRA